MQASIIIPTFNRSNQISRCLNSLIALDFPLRDYEIIIVDNGSNDKTAEVVEGFIKNNPQHIIRYFYDNIPGLLTGRHLGAKQAKSEILIFIDDDIHADKDWLTAIVETFNRQPNVHLVGGKCLPIYEQEPPSWLNFFWSSLEDGGKMLCELSLCDFGEVLKEVDPTLVFGLNFSIRKSSFIELGGFNPDSVPANLQPLQGDGETGLSLKAFKKGFKAIYQPKALVYHEVPSGRMTLDYFDKRYFFQGICNSYTEIRRNCGFVRESSILIFKRHIKDILRPFYLFLIPNLYRPVFSESNFEIEILKVRFSEFEQAGYRFHQRVASNNPDILKWILKENYFDYDLPKL